MKTHEILLCQTVHPTNKENYVYCGRYGYGQRRGEANNWNTAQCNVQQPMLQPKTGKSPKSTQPKAMCSNHNTGNKGRSPHRKIIQRNVQLPWLQARTGRSPKGNTAQGNTLGVSSLTNWRAVSATGASEMLTRSPSFCSFRAQVCWNLFTQGAALGCILIGLSARLCSQHQQAYVTTVMRLLGFQPVFALCINCCTVSWLYAL
ncbi:hypothetical protein [Hoylesella timonensis]|uniref:hypothetical protein n=1 Tax=Hoylesella timonensis TaxID=386414 RepID=UPI0015E0EE37|nr:hypothetical protein [Hoylesella timonensis]